MTEVENYMQDIRDTLSLEKIVSDFEVVVERGGLQESVEDVVRLSISYVTGELFLDHEVAMVIVFPLDQEDICNKLLEELSFEKAKYPLALGYGADCSEYINK